MRRTPVLIVGGGPAGSAAAISLARSGVFPDLLERTSGDRDVVCGGFLSWDTIRALRQLGIEPNALGARPIHSLRLVQAHRTVEVALPSMAAALSRRKLDAALLEAAENRGAVVRRNCAARAADARRRTVSIEGGHEITADAIFLATGKHELRGMQREAKRERGNTAVGLRASLAIQGASERALDGIVEIHLFNSGYAGLVLQEDGSTNLCLSVSSVLLKETGGVPALMNRLVKDLPALRDRIGNPDAHDWHAIAGVPYGWRAPATAPGLFRVGDQAAVIASLAGDGIGIALESGRSAALAFLSEGRGASMVWQAAFSRRSRVALGLGELLRTAAGREPSRRLVTSLLGAAPGLARAAARLTRIC